MLVRFYYVCNVYIRDSLKGLMYTCTPRCPDTRRMHAPRTADNTYIHTMAKIQACVGTGQKEFMQNFLKQSLKWYSPCIYNAGAVPVLTFLLVYPWAYHVCFN